MKRFDWLALTLAAVVVGLPTVTTLHAATVYYVDFDAGSDTADGQSPQTPFMHCPGDGSATGTAAATTLAPGDTVVFAGGVRYRSTVRCRWSGAEGHPITYDGNAAGTFGAGRAVIDGAEPLTGWAACQSADDAEGNPNWASLYVARVPGATNVFIANMYEGSQTLWPAQDPNLADPFYPDDLSTFRPIHSDNVTRTSLTDPGYFTQADPDYWDGAYLRLWGNPNVVRIVRITGYVPAEHKVTFADTGETSLYSNRTVYYATANHILKLDTPGEYVVSETPEPDGTRKIWLWPRTPGDPDQKEITYSVRRLGFDLRGYDHLVIRGFLIRKMTADDNEWGNGCAIIDRFGSSNVLIRDNEMTLNYSHEKQGTLRMYGGCNDVVIEDNSLHLNPHNAGMIVTLTDGIVRNNRLHKNGGTAIDFYGCVRSQMLGNTVTEHTGVHANGLTLYLDCQDCLVAYNTVWDGFCALTVQDGTNLTFAYNVLHTDVDAYTVGDWGRNTGLRYYNNVMLNAYAKALIQSSSTTDIVVRNNIIDGCGVGSGDHVSHNIYTDLMWNQKPQYGWSLGEGELHEEDKTLIFADPAARDFHLKAGSPAIDAGTDVGLTLDHDGAAVPHNGVPDIGAFEFGSVPATGSIRAWNVVATHGGQEIVTAAADGYVEPREAGISKLRIEFHAALDPGTVAPSVVTIAGDSSGDLSDRVQSVTLSGSDALVVVLSAPLPAGERFTVAVTDALHQEDGSPVAGDLDVRLAALPGDADGSGSVTAADVLAVRARAGQAVDAATARYDLDASGQTTGADALLAHRHLGSQLP